jgi:hypothetical protein
MAKKDHKVVENTVSSPAAVTPSPSAPAAPPVDVAATPAAVVQKPMTEQTSAIVAAPPTALDASISAQTKLLAERVGPMYEEDVLLTPRPSPKDMISLVGTLSADIQTKVLKLIQKANPKKQGAHGSKTGFTPTAIRLYQGTGNDAMRPVDMIPGQMYAADSTIIGKEFIGVPVMYFEGRIMWPKKDPAGGDTVSAPLCHSFDRKTGSKYGVCAKCPNEAWGQGCSEEVTIYFVDQNITALYEMKFSKTSQGAGKAIVNAVSKATNLWDRWISVTMEVRVDGSKKWWVFKAAPVADAKNPANNETPKELHPLFDAFSRVITHDIFFTGIADVNDRLKGSADAGGPASPGETFDEKALLGNAATSDNPDYSTPVKDV